MRSIQSYPRGAREAALLPGGIGTGNVSVGAREEFRDREIFNGPGKGNYLPSAFIALRTSGHHVPPVSQVPESELAGDSGEPDALKPSAGPWPGASTGYRAAWPKLT